MRQANIPEPPGYEQTVAKVTAMPKPLKLKKKGKRKRKNKGSTTNHPDPSVEQRRKFTRFLEEQVQEDLSVQESDGFESVTWPAFLAGCNAANSATNRLTCTVCQKQFDYPLESWGRNP